MPLPVTLSALDLGALLCSRICHDIISPVGAINNGLELLEEGGADEDAMALIKSSARNASARLQFARIAFGAAGSAGVQIDTGDAQTVATEYFKNEKPELTWEGTRVLLPKNKVKKAAIPSRALSSRSRAACCAFRQSSWSCIQAPLRKSLSMRIPCSLIIRCCSPKKLA
jgi:Histidine phosphotransferase C-terminal domain